MERDDIIRMAREAELPLAWISESGVLTWSELERFAALVAAEKDKEILQLITDWVYMVGIAERKRSEPLPEDAPGRDFLREYVVELEKAKAERDELLAKLQWIADQEQTARDCMNAPSTFAVVLATCAAEAIRARGEK